MLAAALKHLGKLGGLVVTTEKAVNAHELVHLMEVSKMIAYGEIVAFALRERRTTTRIRANLVVQLLLG